MEENSRKGYKTVPHNFKDFLPLSLVKHSVLRLIDLETGECSAFLASIFQAFSNFCNWFLDDVKDSIGEVSTNSHEFGLQLGSSVGKLIRGFL